MGLRILPGLQGFGECLLAGNDHNCGIVICKGICI